MPDLSQLGLVWLIALFLAGAVLVWFAGARLSSLASEISDRTGLGNAVIGVILLGGATSLPEIATSGVATLSGNPGMAVNNLLGGVAFQVVVLAFADLYVGKGALTTMLPTPRVMLNAVVTIMLLVLALIGVTIGDIAIVPGALGLFPVLIVIAYIAGLWLLGQRGSGGGWKPDRARTPPTRDAGRSDLSNTRLAVFSLLTALAILVGGTIVTLSAEAIAGQTGIDPGIAGLTFVAVATSLPEISTAVGAVRLGKAELAIGDVLGGNMFDIALILLVDGLYTGGLILREADAASTVMALTAIFLTGLLLLGMIERRDRAVLRMGYDMIAILLCYSAAIVAIVAGGVV